MVSNNIVRFAFGLGALGLSLVAQKLPEPPVKVTVNGRSIDTSPLTASRVSAEQIFRLNRNRAPTSASDEDEVTKIMDDRRCELLVMRIEDAMVRQQIEKFGIGATEEEQRAYLAQFPELAKLEAEAAKIRERGLALREGFAQVFEKGHKPEDVYPNLSARLGFTMQAWLANVELARDPNRRESIYKWMIGTTVDQMRSAAGRIDAAHAVKLAKLKRLIFEEPSLKHFHQMPPGAIIVNNQDAVFQNFLRSEMSRTTVTLDDMTWYDRCGLAKLGLHVPGAGK
jgi:hypothetical protein